MAGSLGVGRVDAGCGADVAACGAGTGVVSLAVSVWHSKALDALR